jgi:hypothetical protein
LINQISVYLINVIILHSKVNINNVTYSLIKITY